MRIWGPAGAASFRGQAAQAVTGAQSGTQGGGVGLVQREDLWLGGTGGMGHNYNYYYYHSSIL